MICRRQWMSRIIWRLDVSSIPSAVKDPLLYPSVRLYFLILSVFSELLPRWRSFSLSLASSPDSSDGAGGGGGVLSLLAPPPCGASLGRVWLLPPEPGLLRPASGGPLPGLQQLLRQPRHLRFPVREFPKGLQAGVPLSDHWRFSTWQYQGGPQQGGHTALH